MLYYTPGNVAIPCQSTETQIWMSLMNRGRNTEVQGCARTWQLLKCYTSTCQSLEGESQPPRRYRWGVRDQRQISLRMLYPSAYESIGQKWGHKEAHFESLPGPEELKTVNEVWRGLTTFFFFQIFKIYLPLFYIFCLPNLLHDSEYLLVPDGRCEMGLTMRPSTVGSGADGWPMNAWSI